MLLAAGATRAEYGTSPPVPATEPFGIALEGFPYPYPVHKRLRLMSRPAPTSKTAPNIRAAARLRQFSPDDLARAGGL